MDLLDSVDSPDDMEDEGEVMTAGEVLQKLEEVKHVNYCGNFIIAHEILLSNSQEHDIQVRNADCSIVYSSPR